MDSDSLCTSKIDWEACNAINEVNILQRRYGEPSCISIRRGGIACWLDVTLNRESLHPRERYISKITVSDIPVSSSILDFSSRRIVTVSVQSNNITQRTKDLLRDYTTLVWFERGNILSVNSESYLLALYWVVLIESMNDGRIGMYDILESVRDIERLISQSTPSVDIFSEVENLFYQIEDYHSERKDVEPLPDTPRSYKRQVSKVLPRSIRGSQDVPRVGLCEDPRSCAPIGSVEPLTSNREISNEGGPRIRSSCAGKTTSEKVISGRYNCKSPGKQVLPSGPSSAEVYQDNGGRSRNETIRFINGNYSHQV